MELELERSSLPCLQRKVWETQKQEQTLEVRVSEGMPDIGTVLGAWGQCVLRSKEWRSDSVGVSGGVMAWVLYAPADGGEPVTVEAWLPVQMKWNLSDSKREGTLRTSMQLRSIDARSLSARKLMVRANLDVLTEAMEPWEAEYRVAQQVPEDVQLLKRCYPARLPRETGEKTFLMEETLPFPAGSVAPEKLVSYSLQPKVTEEKVVGGKAVFRGEAVFHVLYRGVDGKYHSLDFDVPYSQFSDLDRDYEANATLSVMMVVSNLEPELQEGGIQLKCGMVAQYLVYDICTIEIPQDAYSPVRRVDIEQENLELPMQLDSGRRNLSCDAHFSGVVGTVVDACVHGEHPIVRRAGELTELELSGTAQLLYYDTQDNLQVATARWQDTWEYPAARAVSIMGTMQSMEKPIITAGADGIALHAEVEVEAVTTAGQALPMIATLTMGEVEQPRENRPSLILRRAGEVSLWELAKESGSTVEAIKKANHLTEEPLDDRMLLIPVS